MATSSSVKYKEQGEIENPILMESMDQECLIQSLPLAIKEIIFGYLPLTTLLTKASLVCKDWNYIINNDRFLVWRKKFRLLKMKAIAAPEHEYNLQQNLINSNVDRDSVTNMDLGYPVLALWRELRDYVIEKNMTKRENLIFGLIKEVEMFGNQNNSEILYHLQNHRNYRGAICILKNIFPKIKEDYNAFSVIAVLVVISESIEDIELVLKLMSNAKCPININALTECFYYLASMFYFTTVIMKTGRCFYYRLAHVLYHFENTWYPNPPQLVDEVVVTNIQKQADLSEREETIEWTAEQLLIINQKLKRYGIVKITGFAGTGRTTTLIGFAKKHPELNILYITPNKFGCASARERFPSNVDCQTLDDVYEKINVPVSISEKTANSMSSETTNKANSKYGTSEKKMTINVPGSISETTNIADSIKELMNTKEQTNTADFIKQILTPSDSFKEIFNASASFKEILNESDSIKEILNASASFKEILNASNSIKEILNASDSFKEILNASEPMYDSDSSEEPINASESNEEPMNASDSIKESMNASDSIKEPMNASDSIKEPMNASDSIKEPMNASDSIEKPMNASDSIEKPMNASDSIKEPMNASDYSEEPINASDSSEEPINASESKEEPMNDSDSIKEPMNASDSSEEPINASESNEEPMNDSDSSEESINNSDSREDPINDSDSERDRFIARMDSEERKYKRIKAFFDVYDYILVDDAEDCSPAKIGVLKDVWKPILFVECEHHQIIYFEEDFEKHREDHKNNFDDEYFDEEEYWLWFQHYYLFRNISRCYSLTRSFRFGPEIARVADMMLHEHKFQRQSILIGGKQKGFIGEKVIGQLAIISTMHYYLVEEAIRMICLKDLKAWEPKEIKAHFIGGIDNLEEMVAKRVKNKKKAKIFVARIREACTGDIKNSNLIFATVEECKGMEFDSVMLTRGFDSRKYPFGWWPFIHINKLNCDCDGADSLNNMTDSQLNSIYLAVTRAKKCLLPNEDIYTLFIGSDEWLEYPVFQTKIEKKNCCDCENEMYSTPDTFLMARKKLILANGDVPFKNGFLCFTCATKSEYKYPKYWYPPVECNYRKLMEFITKL